MEKSKNNQIIIFPVITGAFIGLMFGVLELVFILIRMRLTLEELFLLRTWDLNLPISFYSMAFYMPLGACLSTLGLILFNIKVLHTLGEAFHPVFCTLVLGIITMAIRTYIYTVNHGPLLVFYFALFLGLTLFVLIVLAAYKVLTKRMQSILAYGKIASWFMVSAIIGTLLTALFLPDLYVIAKQSEVHGPNKNSNLPNILLIVMDTVRADHLSCYGYHRKITPNIDKISKEGALFTRAFSAAPWTLSSHASMFTGLYPSQHGAGWEYQHLDEQFVTLAEYLSEKGYRTVGLSENPFFVTKEQGLTQGFEYFYPIYSYCNKPIALRIADSMRKVFFKHRKTFEYTENTVSHFESWILRNYRSNKPFFAFINFMAGHLPNYPRPGFIPNSLTSQDFNRIQPVNELAERFYIPKYKLNDRELDIMRTIYAGDIAYLDSKIGEMISFMKENDILDNTILIITSDHGENFGEHGYLEHQFCIYNSLLHVPLIVRYPKKVDRDQVIGKRVSTVFLFQTVLDLVGKNWDRPLPHFEGRSLFQRHSGEVIYAEYDNAIKMLKDMISTEAPPDFDYGLFDRSFRCMYDGNYKFIWSSNGEIELFDIMQDFHENINIIRSQHEKAAYLSNKLFSWHESLWKPTIARKVLKMDEDAKSALKSLGYIK